MADRADDVVDEGIRARNQDPAVAVRDRQDGGLVPEESGRKRSARIGARRIFASPITRKRQYVA